MPLHITEAQVKELLTNDSAIEAVTSAQLSLSAGSSDNVTRTRARSPKMSLHSLSATSDELGFAAAKIYSATRHGVSSLVLLYQMDSGELVATIEANELGRKRTVAASIVAANLLLKDPPNTAAIIGAGFQAEGIVDAISTHQSLSNISTIRIASRSRESAQRFSESQQAKLPCRLEACDSPPEAVRGAALIFTATTSSKPLFELSDIPDAKCICALGSNSLARRELSPRVVTAANSVIVDSIEVAKAEAGDLLSPVENGKLRWSQMLELGDCLSHPELIADKDQGFGLFCSQGLALQDLYSAHKVFQQLVR